MTASWGHFGIFLLAPFNDHYNILSRKEFFEVL
jgi:hypothetical protein